MNYVNLDLQVTVDRRETNSYQVIASTSGRDRRIVSEGFFLPIGQRWDTVEQSLIELGARPARDAAPTRDHARQIRDFGKELFYHLINGEVRRLYDDKKREAERNNRPLRLRLALVPFELVILPWELLCDERDNEYLCLTRKPEILLIRSIENTRVSRPRSPKPSNEHAPLRILGMIADPKDQERLRGAKEKNLIEDALRPLRENQRVKLDWTNTGKYRELFTPQGDTDRYDVFHFIGHGRFEQRSQQGQLVFEKPDGNSEYIPARQFRLALHRDLQLVVLNACETARGDPLDRFSNLAYSLAENGIPAVVAMQFKILDEASLRFAEAFYTLLEKGEVIEEAVAQARRRIYSAAEEEYRLDWAAPLLYTSSARSVSLRSPARQQVSQRASAPAEGNVEVGILSAASAQGAKAREVEPVIELDPVEKAPIFIPGAQETRGLLPGSPSLLPGRGLSREKKRMLWVAVLLITLLLGSLALVVVHVFASSLSKTLCLATDFSIQANTPEGDVSDVPLKKGAELAIKNNARLGSGYTLLLNCADKNDNNGQGINDPNVGLRNLQDLLSDSRVVAMVGPGSSDVVVKDLLLAAQHAFPMVSPNTTNPCLTQPEECAPSVDLQGRPNPYMRICATDIQQGLYDADFMTNTRALNVHKVYVVNDGTVYGRGLTSAFQDQFRNSDDGTVLDLEGTQISSSMSDTQFMHIAQKILALGAQAVFYGGRASNGIVQLIRQLDKQHFTGVLMSGDGVALDTQFIAGIGGDVSGIYASSLVPAIQPNTDFYKSYRTMYGSNGSDPEISLAAGGYDAAMILINAMQQVIRTNHAGDLHDIAAFRAAVLQVVQNTSGYQGVTGIITLSNGDNAAATTLHVYMVLNKKWVPYSRS
jgi:ABC-type branched-subunit amino acid transport system substrate-binding protein